MAIGLAALLLIAGGFGGWAATAELAGAVLAEGTVVVDSNVKKVQHPTGGVVGEIRVRDGDWVAAGALLLRLDDTINRANLQIITGQLDELAMRSARLIAERDGAGNVVAPAMFAERSDEPTLREMIAAEGTLFDSRRMARAGQKAQLVERIAQLSEEIVGLDGQEAAKASEVDLIEQELIGLLKLREKDLVPSIRVVGMQRESARLGGERSQLVAAAAQARGRIAETRLQILQLDQDFKTEVMGELREIQAKQAELNERRAAAQDQLKRIDIRSPQAGIVHQLSVHTVGGVISQSEPIMLIVPSSDALVIEAKVAPQDIDHVTVGQSAVLRFPAFNQQTTPEFSGSVQRVAADLTREPQLGQAYFLVRITLPEAELKRMGALRLVPGMPAEVQIRTGDRTPLSYLMKPLSDQVARAFKES